MAFWLGGGLGVSYVVCFCVRPHLIRVNEARACDVNDATYLLSPFVNEM